MHDSHLERRRFRTRAFAAALFVVFGFSLLLARFLWLQWHQHEQYSAKAEDNRIAVRPIEPLRGIIKDRNGVVLAQNETTYTLEIKPSKLAGMLDATIEELGTLVEITPRDRRRFRELLNESRDLESIPIRSRLSEDEMARFTAQRFRFPGVELLTRPVRQYPLGEAASHVVGYLGRLARTDQERIHTTSEANRTDDVHFDPRKQADNYRGTRYIGKTGVEQSYETELHGLSGFEQVEINAAGHPVRTLTTTPAIPGNDLVLSLDIRLQQLAEALYGQRRGALVAIEPATGEILAFVSKPTFDPNAFIDGIDSETWNRLNTSADKPLLNRALRSTYPPASTYKPFMALAGLSSGKRNAVWSVHDPGFFQFGTHRFRDSHPGGHGWVDLHGALVHSCDTYFYMLARDLGVDAIHDFMKPLGFGELTGIDLEGEAHGTLPSLEWKRRVFHSSAQQRWLDGDTISLGVGQGYNSFTLLQLAQATSVMINGGKVMKPHLVRAIDHALTHRRTLLAPRSVDTIALRPADVELVKQGMVDVTRSGTAARAFAGAAYVSGGKTGTAQTYSLSRGEKYDAHTLEEGRRDHALYIAFAPAQEPRIVLALIIENAGFGAVHAAPLARTLLDYYLLGQWPQELETIVPVPARPNAPLASMSTSAPLDAPSATTTQAASPDSEEIELQMRWALSHRMPTRH